MHHIYDENGFLISIKHQGTDEEFKEEYGNNIYISEENLGEKAIIENDTIREYTRLDKIAEGLELLQEGEYVKNNEIITIEKPSLFHIWDSKINKWNYDKSLEITTLNSELADLESVLLSKYDELDKSIARKLKTLEKRLNAEIEELMTLIDEKYSKLDELN
ncbi:MAG: hypothetical protein KBF12_06100 [Sebaldella sp.]|nr:hypothetical protein [Sebaldella sp.]